ncbi:MAG: phosphate signaling complex protein PhoU [Desulfocurvibacter africanus]
METHFHHQLETLKLRVLEMGALADKAVEKALRALAERNYVLAEEVMEGDARVNELQCEVDERSLRLLALDQPMAKDLRFIVGSIHIVTNLERAGDQAVNIAERAVLFAQRQPLDRYPVFDELAEITLDMLRKALQAYNTGDTELAAQVCAMDARADTLNLKVLKHYIEFMIQESRAVERAVHMIILGKCLERIGDLATNVAEYVQFIVKGVNVKNSCRRM